MQDTKKSSLSSDGSLGIFTTVALILLLWGICWLKSYAPFQSQQHINVMFKEVAGLHADARVSVDGVKAGVVEKVDWKSNNQVLVRLRITHPHMIIPQGAQFNIFSNGIIGAKYIDIDLPDTDKSVQQPIDESMIVMGGDAPAVEDMMNKLGHDLEKVDIERIQQNVTEGGKALRHAADQVSMLATKAMPVVDHALPLEDNLAATSAEIKRTLNKFNKFADNPKLSADLRETASKASEAAQAAQATISELNNMAADKSLRNDLRDTMSQLNQSTAHFEKSIEMIQQVSKDQALRSDVKQILLDARKAIEKLDEILNNPNAKSDIPGTLKKTESTLDDIDQAARQLQQILDQKHPLIHMFMGRPGHIKVQEQVDVDTKSP